MTTFCLVAGFGANPAGGGLFGNKAAPGGLGTGLGAGFGAGTHRTAPLGWMDGWMGFPLLPFVYNIKPLPRHARLYDADVLYIHVYIIYIHVFMYVYISRVIKQMFPHCNCLCVFLCLCVCLCVCVSVCLCVCLCLTDQQ